jgi:hypothetical protein
MKFLHAAAFAVMLSLASVPVVSAQEPEQNKEKPKQQDEEKKKRPAEKEKSKSDEKAKADTRNEKDKAKPETDRRDQAQRQDDRTRQDERSATHEQQSGRNDADRGRGHRIPDERFRASFGTEHHFHVRHHDNRRFEYGGYSFEYVDAWPADWSDDDDVYIVLIGDDYYLVDARYPEVRLRLILVD